ncbi:hypothetical protein [Rubrobacter aplysinae]|uniref:hypothetical protein n=1 Tax=Rubrobacter aplysinae TaxID=909625 RepID=UPI00064BADB3|nr:hypothetical protein [Rubrobacter aplysinae]
MTELTCTARRIGDYESRTEEYELTFSADDAEPETLQIKYQAARAFEITRSLDWAVETARRAIARTDPDLAKSPSDETLTQFSWKTLQSAKYEEGEPKTSTLEV